MQDFWWGYQVFLPTQMLRPPGHKAAQSGGWGVSSMVADAPTAMRACTQPGTSPAGENDSWNRNCYLSHVRMVAETQSAFLLWNWIGYAIIWTDRSPIFFFLTWLHFCGAFSLTVIPATMLHFYDLRCQCSDFFFLKLVCPNLLGFCGFTLPVFVWFPVIVDQVWACCNIDLSCLSSFPWWVFSRNKLCSSVVSLHIFAAGLWQD